MITEERLTALLKQHRLNITRSRLKILNLFLNAENALDNYFIEKKVQLDRVTVYRTLRSFLEKGIIHTIPTHDFSIQYALCKNGCDEHRHVDTHLHFISEKCGKAFCLNEKGISSPTLPNGFITHRVDVLLTGLCKLCSSRKSSGKANSL